MHIFVILCQMTRVYSNYEYREERGYDGWQQEWLKIGKNNTGRVEPRDIPHPPFQNVQIPNIYLCIT